MATLWQEAKTPEGRVYYYNTQTRETRWEKPAEMSQQQAQMPTSNASPSANPWREYTEQATGRKYYHNVETKKTTWEMPAAFRQAQAQSQASPTKAAAPTFVAGGGLSNFQPQQQRDDRRQSDRHDRAQAYAQAEGYRQTIQGGHDKSQYATREEAEAAFIKLLKQAGVEPGWSWDEAMKATIKDPQYRALDDPKERKAAFEKFVVQTKEQDKERAKERFAKLRQDFAKMLQSHPEIKYYTRWKTARPIIEGETIFRSSSDDTERRQLYEEYIVGLKKAHAEHESENRKSALNELTDILKSLKLDPYTRWADARGSIKEHEASKADDKFKSLTPSDELTAFEDHVKALEIAYNDQKQRDTNKKLREERQHRDQFMNLMRELRTDGRIKAGTNWKDVQPLIKDDPRYKALLGQTGSTPLDLFWDAVEDEEREYRAKRNAAVDVLDDQNFELKSQTTLEEFAEVMKRDQRTAGLSEADVELVYTRLHEKIVRREKEDKAHAERHIRHAIDALRSRIRHLHPPVTLEDEWETVRSRIERFDEYRALETDEQRKTAFEKVIRRLREKEADAEAFEKEKAMRRAEREREDRYVRYGRHTSRYSRSPEADAYEADRKKAQAARERQYRKASGTGLSPPRHRDDRYDRYHRHDRDRGERDRGGYHDFDREYRDRERTYRSRLSDATGGLDYDDGGRAGSSTANPGGRRRRESGQDAEGERRDSKRLRSGKSEDEDAEMRDMREEVEKKAKEEENLKSGSEEGEIEEV